MASYTVDHVDVTSLAKVLGIIGLIWGLLLAVMWLVVGMGGMGAVGVPELVVAVVGGGLCGTVVVAVAAMLYNAAASLVGGVQFDLASGDA